MLGSGYTLPAERKERRDGWGERVNRLFDRCNLCTLQLAGRRVSSFQVCGFTGLAVAISLALWLVHGRGLALWVIALVSLAGMATFLVLAMLTKLIGGEEDLIYYHHEIAVLAVAALLLEVLEQPTLPYIDATILGVGSFLTFVRVGCFMVGCCNGHPCAIGVRYRREHAEAGFPSYLVGTRFLPIQLIESAAVLFIVAIGTTLWVRGCAPGAVLVWYSVAYGALRFLFEYFRGDPARPYLGALSEGQWTSVLILALIALGGIAGRLPVEPWHLWVSGGVFLAAAVSLSRGGPERRLCQVRHLCEIAGLLDAATERARSVGLSHTGTTSLGVLVSAHAVREGGQDVKVWSLSVPDPPLPAESLERLVAAVARLKGLDDAPWQPSAGVYHLVLPAERGAHAL